MPKITLEQVAEMVANGFTELSSDMNSRFEAVETRLTRLERGQEEILWRLDNKVNKIDFDEFKKKVRYKPGM